MKRQTSIEAYNEIKQNGLLSQRRWQVYNILFKYGPLTTGELFEIFKKTLPINPGSNPSIHSRLGELRALGVVQELGTKPCNVSSMKVILWDVTDKIPKNSPQNKIDRLLKEKRTLEKRLRNIVGSIQKEIKKMNERNQVKLL